MEKINTLLALLKTAISAALQKRIDKVVELKKKLAEAIELNNAQKTEASQQSVDDLTENINDMVDDIVVKLEKLVEAEKETPTPEEPTPTPEEPKEEDGKGILPHPKPKKKSNGLAGLVFFGVLTVLTLGAIKMSNKG